MTSYKCVKAATASVTNPTGPDNPTKIDTTDSAYNGVMGRIASLFAWLVGVAVITLDNVVFYTVITMGDYVHKLSAIGITWRILRDISNIALIFGFLAIGINTIIGEEYYGWGQKLLPRLLMAAVFLNFSLFITEAVIDTGNLFATQFYTQINGGTPAGAKPISLDAISNAANNGIANKIMGKLGLQNIYGAALDTKKPLFEGGNPWYIGFMCILLFITTAFVMFSLAFILIARFIALIFIIITAPIGFAGWAIPKLSGISDQWWGELTSQTITAPVLLLMLYIALMIITDVNFLSGFGDKPEWLGFVQNSSGVTNFTGFASMILSFLVAMGLLLAVTMYAKKLGAWGADVATKWAGRATFGLTATTAGFVGRRTLGRASNYAARTIRSSQFGATSAGRVMAGFADRGAKGSFDVRGTKAFGSLNKSLGAVGLGSLEAGEAHKGGYRDRVEKTTKSRDDYAKTLGPNQEAQRDALRYQSWQLQTQINAAQAQGNQALVAQLTAQRNNIENVLIPQATQVINNMQVQYANSLNNWWSQSIPTTGSAARNEAARQVRKRLATPAHQRLLQDLQAALNPPPAGQPPQPAGQPPHP